MIAVGAMSPLEGFMCKADYDNVVDNMRLSNGFAMVDSNCTFCNKRKIEGLQTREGRCPCGSG